MEIVLTTYWSTFDPERHPKVEAKTETVYQPFKADDLDLS
jgi:hypothetical protein